MKLLLRFFIALFILLFSGLGQVFANNLPKQDITCFQQVKTNNAAQGSITSQNDWACIRDYNSSETKKKYSEPEETEIEESQEDLNSFKKDVDNSHFEVLFYALLSKYLSGYPNNNLFHSRNSILFQTHSPAYIRFCVLRI
ncbi:hypothetical protein [Zunongwangia sp. H14]|uniref:hypothetical protein n=1 Tax=Zunongwangia sp. H14 TaxID=3240792 RepID=UPI003563A107